MEIDFLSQPRRKVSQDFIVDIKFLLIVKKASKSIYYQWKQFWFLSSNTIISSFYK